MKQKHKKLLLVLEELLRHLCQELAVMPYAIFRVFFPKPDGRRRSHPISKFLRRYLEKRKLKSILGVNLILLVCITNLILRPISAFDVVKQEPTILPQPEENVVTTTVFRKPVGGRLCQDFHRWHPAIDICAPIKTPIIAIADGEVIEASYSRLGWGNTVVVKHQINNQEYYSRYAHLAVIQVKVGDQVTDLKIIGNIGMTGWTTGPHLHLELRTKTGQALNPAEYLPTFNYFLAGKK
ncbi:M23 family metallopeptidase [Patescibacteria group bacterium]|nr:M23 family metallopeptidase [Patescibacteria group bacterium]MBU1931269.1 M23 family metallopeptidase [Patescibacteria group bacterium]